MPGARCLSDRGRVGVSKEMVWPLLIARGEQGQGHKVELTRGGRRCLSRPGLSHSPSPGLRPSTCLSVPLRLPTPPPDFQPINSRQRKKEDREPQRTGGQGGARGCLLHSHWIRGHWMQDDLGRPGRRLRHWYHVYEPEVGQTEHKRGVHNRPKAQLLEDAGS